MASEVEKCNSCLLNYNRRDRIPKILSCYHTYCKCCLEAYMYSNGTVECLSCGKKTFAASISSLPENPYFNAAADTSHRESGGAEEVYYSDSDDDDSSSSRSTHAENGLSSSHVQGVKTMVLNTHMANMDKVKQLIHSTGKKIQSSRAIVKAREELLKESIEALSDFKNKVLEELKALQAKSADLASQETKLNNLDMQLNAVDMMDFPKLKSLSGDVLAVKNNLKQEVEKVQLHQLEQAIRQSRAIINIDTQEHLLINLQADNDRINVRLNSTLQTDSSLEFLTTFMISTFFAQNISTKNFNFKEFVKRAYVEDGKDVPPSLDDPSEYIDYLKAFQNISVSPVSAVRNHVGAPSPRENIPAAAEDAEWKVVGSKEKKEIKKTAALPSFSEMAKRPGNPQPVKRVPFPEKTIAQTNRPRCFFKIQVDNEPPFRVVIELRPDMAPKMVDNFIRLCKGLPDGRGYKGSKIFRAKADDHILGGDFENDDGTGGHSAYDEKYFLAEQCPLKDHKGAIRMKGLERTADGRCRIGSQFMIWVGNLDYKEYKFTLVFGQITEGFDKLVEISRIKAVQKSPTSWVLRQTVTIVDSGVL